MLGNLEFIIATSAANTCENEGENAWACIIERANNPLEIKKNIFKFWGWSQE